jgi:hypothetical protein
VPLIEHRGERILVIRDEVEVRSDFSPAELELHIEAPEEPGELREAIGTTNERPATFFTFLRRDGVFFANGASAVYRAIDRLTDGPSDQPPGRVESLLTALSSEHQVRGAFLNDNLELLELLRASDEDSPELEALLSEVDSATLAGGFTSAGDGVLEIELRSRGPLPMRAELERLVAEHVAAAEDDLELEWNVEDTSHGARIHLRIPDVAGQLHGWTERLRDQRSVEIDVEADGEAVEIGVER